MYKGEELAQQRLDMLVDNVLVIETKATIELHSTAQRQLFNYLRATRLNVGLLLHFGPKPRFYRLICRGAKLSPPDSMPSPMRDDS
jgi:GxxExxY protein